MADGDPSNTFPPPIDDLERGKFDPDEHDSGDIHPLLVAQKDFSVEYGNEAFTDTTAEHTLTNESRLLRLHADQDCWVRFDATDATSTTAVKLLADQPETFAVRTTKINVIRDAVSGNLNICNFY